jgi:hypothetical protein
VVSPSPATVIRPGKAASTRLVLPVPRRAVQQSGDSGLAEPAQRLDVGHVRQRAGLVDLTAWPGHRAGHGRLRRGGRPGSRWGGGGPGRGGCLGGDGGGCGVGRGVGPVADRLAGLAAGLAPVGQGGQRVADRPGGAAKVFGDLAGGVRAGAGGQPFGDLAAKLAVAEPARRGGGKGGGGHREYLREMQGGNCHGVRALRHYRASGNAGGFPGISGYTTTLSRLSRGSQRISGSNKLISAPIPAHFVTHRCGRDYGPPSRLFPPGEPAFPAPFPGRPPAASRILLPGRTTSRHRVSTHLGARAGSVPVTVRLP